MSSSHELPKLPPLQCLDPSLPRLVSSGWRCWFRRLGIAVVLAAIIALAFRYDIALMQWRNAKVVLKPETTLIHWVDGFRTFGTSFSVCLVLILVAICDRRRIVVLLTLIAAQAFASAAYSSTKYLVVRYRPYEMTARHPDLEGVGPADLWGGWQVPPRCFALESFPSGHSAASFALATTLAWFYPPLRVVVFTLASGCALTRFLEARHWASDCICGAILGYLCAWLILRIHWIPALWPFRRSPG